MSRRHRWTARHCYAQLRSNGIELAIGEEDKLILRAPEGIDLRPMLWVLRLYKPGLMRILRGEDKAREDVDPATIVQAGKPGPPSLALCRKIEIVKTTLADLQPTVVSVVLGEACVPSDEKKPEQPLKLTPFGFTEILRVSTTPPKDWDPTWAQGDEGEVYVTTKTPTNTGDITSTSRLLPGGSKLGHSYEYWWRLVDDGETFCPTPTEASATGLVVAQQKL